MKDLLVKSNCSYNKIATKAIQNYFIETNTVYDAFLYLTENLNATLLPYALFGFIDEKCELELARMYKNGTLKDNTIFTLYVSLLPEDSCHYSEFVELIKAIDGKEFRKSERIDYSQCEIEGINKYFNSLFDSAEYNKLIELYFDEADEEKTLREIWEEAFSVEDVTDKNALINKYCKTRMISDILTCVAEEEKLHSFYIIQRNRLFFIGLMYNQLQDNRITVNENQKKYLYSICLELMQSMRTLKTNLYVSIAIIF